MEMAPLTDRDTSRRQFLKSFGQLGRRAVTLRVGSGVLLLLMGAANVVAPRTWAEVRESTDGYCSEAILIRPIGLLGPLERFVQRMMGGGCGMIGVGSRRASLEERTVQPSTAPKMESAVAGQQVYEGNCAVCHGLRGDGQGMAAHMFSTQPRDFRAGVFKFRSTPSGSLPHDVDLLRILKRGVRRTAMVAQTHLTEAEQHAVIAYLKTFSSRWREEEPEPSIEIPEPPPKTSVRLAAGQKLFQAAGCEQCHGPKGRGDGPQARGLRDDWGWPIRPANLRRRPLKGGSTLQDLYRTLATGIDGTPMPSVGDALSPDDLWALVYYVDSLSPASTRPNPESTVGEEARGVMVERMHGMMGGMRRRMPMMDRMMRRRPMRE